MNNKTKKDLIKSYTDNYFLKSKKYLNDRNQFVVFATPSIIETASENIEEIKAKFLKRGR